LLNARQLRWSRTRSRYAQCSTCTDADEGSAGGPNIFDWIGPSPRACGPSLRVADAVTQLNRCAIPLAALSFLLSPVLHRSGFGPCRSERVSSKCPIRRRLSMDNRNTRPSNGAGDASPESCHPGVRLLLVPVWPRRSPQERSFRHDGRTNTEQNDGQNHRPETRSGCRLRWRGDRPGRTYN
jgi:hypothetical protein